MTGNLGVSALCYATMRVLFAELPSVELAVLDDGWGQRPGRQALDGREVCYSLIGERLSRRYWRPESLWNIRVSSWLGGLANPAARAIRGAQAVLDISGGDSFTDLYGQRRFNTVTLFKKIVLENRVPLILLPQTYGPFSASKNRGVAEGILRQARMAWARDERSFARLKELLGSSFDPERHGCGVDVAFGLESVKPNQPLPETILRWLEDRTLPVAGINVSGLIYNDQAGAARSYGLKAGYREVILGLVRRLLKESDCRIVLVPHVVTPPGHYESDVEACAAVAVSAGSDGRVAVLPALEDPRPVKWVIGQLDWFCGTRMHATIAGLSSGVPTAAIAYSDKTLGVFETCGQGGQVADPRVLGTGEMVEWLLASWRGRGEAGAALRAALPGVLRRAEEQMARIARYCASLGERDACGKAR